MSSSFFYFPWNRCRKRLFLWSLSLSSREGTSGWPSLRDWKSSLFIWQYLYTWIQQAVKRSISLRKEKGTCISIKKKCLEQFTFPNCPTLLSWWVWGFKRNCLFEWKLSKSNNNIAKTWRFQFRSNADLDFSVVEGRFGIFT